MRHSPTPLEELRTAHRPLTDIKKISEASLSPLERLAVKVTESVGSMGFFFVIFGWTLFWLAWNVFGPQELRFDPYPAFVLWLFISNMIQMLLMPLIMIGQSLQNKEASARSKSDFEINFKAEKEIETIIEHLENQEELLKDFRDRMIH